MPSISVLVRVLRKAEVVAAHVRVWASGQALVTEGKANTPFTLPLWVTEAAVYAEICVPCGPEHGPERFIVDRTLVDPRRDISVTWQLDPHHSAPTDAIRRARTMIRFVYADHQPHPMRVRVWPHPVPHSDGFDIDAPTGDTTVHFSGSEHPYHLTVNGFDIATLSSPTIATIYVPQPKEPDTDGGVVAGLRPPTVGQPGFPWPPAC
jgi:hypothetical protein